MKLSAAIIVKNEETVLRQCLQSIADVDELIVVDTGSTDDTIALAQACGATVHQFVWCDDFAAARNYAISKTTGDWVLIIDADEVLEEDGIFTIRKYLDRDVQGFFVNMAGDNNYHSIRIVRPSVRYCGAVHETPSCSDTDCIPVTITAGRSDSHNKDPDRNIRILTDSLRKSRYPRNVYYLAREYVYRQDYKRALVLLDKYLAIGHWLSEIGDAYLLKARCHWYLNEGEQARQACLKALDCNANHKAAAAFMADITFPENARVWRSMAEAADDSGVLFRHRDQEASGMSAQARKRRVG